MSKPLELLSPAKNLEYGKAAISHGADAVYIGGPKFGARQNAAASLAEIEQLIKYAHLYKSKVYVALNTILYENELEAAQVLIKQMYDMGADALIVQDLGLLACDLPPIELHASTQCHIADVDKLRFIQSLGFKRAILARELSLAQIGEFANETDMELESFVHGALCVSYSGQCYMSHALNGRSGNRGECSQACRSKYDLYNASGKLLAAHSYLLSLKDLNASAHLQSLIEAGISSFKIEGRLKDIYYLKNITAYYRQLLDALLADLPDYSRASSGKTDLFFTPDPEKTFHRTYTSYFLDGRTEKTASTLTQKSLGKAVATVVQATDKYITIKTDEEIIAGDGLCFFNENGQLDGFGVNQKQGNRIYPQTMVLPKADTILYRNQDLAFERLLKHESALRKIGVNMSFENTACAFILKVWDEDGVYVEKKLSIPFELSNKGDEAKEQIAKQLSKLGQTPFYIIELGLNLDKPYFIQASQINYLRREALQELEEKRCMQFMPKDSPRTELGQIKKISNYPPSAIDYRANISNSKSLEVYRQMGVDTYEFGFELNQDKDDKVLMTTKHCIRYQLEQCPLHHEASPDFMQDLYLRNNRQDFSLSFDCKNCLMQIKRK